MFCRAERRLTTRSTLGTSRSTLCSEGKGEAEPPYAKSPDLADFDSASFRPAAPMDIADEAQVTVHDECSSGISACIGTKRKSDGLASEYVVLHSRCLPLC